MIQAYSRYKAEAEVRNDSMYVVGKYSIVPTTKFMTIISRDGDSFERLATRHLGGPIFYWRIAQLNPHVPFPDRIPVGTRIRIPR